jgi:DNA-binding FrmR family transcriptional regulator
MALEVESTKRQKSALRAASTKTTIVSMKQTDNLKRVARIRGQIDGVERMMNEGRYCPEIIQQIKSVRAAMAGLECAVLENHLRGCVQKAFEAKDPFEADQKISELINLLKSR